MPLQDLLDHLKKTSALEQAAGLLSWDQETVMPPKGAAQRSEQASALASVIHARQSDPRIPEWIARIDRDRLSPFDQRNVAEAERRYRRATRVPARLAEEMAAAASSGQITWAGARAAKSFADFAPALKRNLDLKREEAACLVDGDGALYDCLLDEFEPGATVATLRPMLQSLRPGLTDLRARIAEKPLSAPLDGRFPKPAQLALALKVAARLGYDMEAGRIDLAAHPFSSGIGGDARITTRVDEANPLDCLYSTIHEVGHALYSQGTPDPSLPAADYCSMGVHESQSRFWENQIGRSRPFAEYLFPEMTVAFGELGLAGADGLYAAVNRVETGFIRTEADEIHYNLHILLRFDLEVDLITGKLEVDDLEDAWNARFLEDFGLKVTDPSLGVLQDVHWSVGLFGYFPTYSLGNIYAACLDAAMRSDIPDRDDLVRAGGTEPILEWLRQRIHKRGRVLPAQDLIEEATGTVPSVAPLMSYLNEKYTALYGL
ncbi:carboxypeptidase M32 [Rhodobacteraceae bacterium NNCM2]|nr:carboxypeptidase M32 [Coraliihabitans acroporae]